MSCSSPGVCAAVGSYLDVNGMTESSIDTLSDGAWTTSEAPAPGDLGATPYPSLGSVVCMPTSCQAIGSYRGIGSTTKAMIVTGP